MSAGRCLLKNGILWDTKKMVDILIDDERIVQIVPGQSLGAVDARIIDLTGKTILPGFFNAHVHLYGVRGPLPDELLHRFVLGGVTTVRDMGVTSTITFEEYQKWLTQRTGPEYPSVISAGKFICGTNTYGAVHPSGALIGYVIDETPEQAKLAVDHMVDTGAH